MKHDLDSLLRSQARRELRDPPAQFTQNVLARLDPALAPLDPVLAPLGRPELAAPERTPRALPRSRFLPFALAGSLAAAALATWILWPPMHASNATPAPRSAPDVALGLTASGLRLAANLDQPLAEEWLLLKRDSQQLYTALLSQLPSQRRAQ